MERDVILSVRDLDVKFTLRGRVLHAIRGVSLDVYRGESLAIVGESGSGKSVFCKTFMGLLDSNGRVTRGSIRYGEKDLAAFKTEKEWLSVRGKEIAMVMQDPMTSLNPLKTVGAQICEALTLHQGMKGEAAKQKATEILEDVGITEAARRFGQYPHEFSGGMRQRAMIAMALSCEPELLIADEPTTALDVTIQAQVLSLMKELNERLGTATILITHNLGCASSICDRIIVMYGGKIMEEGTTEEIFYEPHHPYTMGLLNSVPKVTGEASKERLVPILGTPPDMLHPPTGCPFYPRCKYAMKVCASMPVPEQYISDTHRVSCFMCHPQAPRNEEYESQKGGIRHAK